MTANNTNHRSSLRIHNIESDNENVLEEVKKCYNVLDLPICKEEIDRLHRISKTYKDKNSGKKR